MKVGINQPYLFPYIGYYQLLAAVDHFVVFDDVAFIKKGWINRNRILASAGPHTFTVPVRGASSHARIDEVVVSTSEYGTWRRKFLRTLAHSYSESANFAAVRNIIESALPEPGEPFSIRDAAVASLCLVMDHLGLTFEHSYSSDYDLPEESRGLERGLEICRRLGATDYYNAPGGKELYTENDFAPAGIDLHFVVPRRVQYAQPTDTFVPWLSIIDVLMFNSPAQVRRMLGEYELQ